MDTELTISSVLSSEPIVTDPEFAEQDLTDKFKEGLWRKYGLRSKDLDTI